jgi:hypothetical protein
MRGFTVCTDRHEIITSWISESLAMIPQARKTCVLYSFNLYRDENTPKVTGNAAETLFSINTLKSFIHDRNITACFFIFSSSPYYKILNACSRASVAGVYFAGARRYTHLLRNLSGTLAN